MVGLVVGLIVGEIVGLVVGLTVGDMVGLVVGLPLGNIVGLTVPRRSRGRRCCQAESGAESWADGGTHAWRHRRAGGRIGDGANGWAGGGA